MHFVISLLIGCTPGSVFEESAQAFFFRRAPIRRLLFGGPIRRRMFARPMMRGPSCGNCLPRRPVGPRCGNGNHGGFCPNNSRNFRDFRDFQDIRNFQDQNFRDLRDVPTFQDFERNFQDTGNPFLRRNQFDSTFDPGFGLTGAPAPSGFPNVPVSKVEKVKEESIKDQYAKGIKPEDSQELLASSWKGKCEKDSSKKRTISFSIPEKTNITETQSAALLQPSDTEKYEMKMSQDGTKLLVKITKEETEEYCALEKNQSGFSSKGTSEDSR